MHFSLFIIFMFLSIVCFFGFIGSLVESFIDYKAGHKSAFRDSSVLSFMILGGAVFFGFVSYKFYDASESPHPKYSEHKIEYVFNLDTLKHTTDKDTLYNF